jgi:hypothetical protein
MVSHLPTEVFCCYINDTNQHQIVRISNIPCWFFERAVFPGQSVTFWAFAEGLLEVHTGVFSGSTLADIIACDRLRQQPVCPAHSGSSPGVGINSII